MSTIFLQNISLQNMNLNIKWIWMDHQHAELRTSFLNKLRIRIKEFLLKITYSAP